MVWLYLGIFSFIIAMAVAVALTGFKVNMGVLKFIASYPGLFVFGTIFILALHWIDRRAINKQTI